MFCPKCGKEISDGNKFCGACGFKTDGILDGKPVNATQKESEKSKRILPVFLIVICATLIIAMIFCPIFKLSYNYGTWYESRDVVTFNMLYINGERDHARFLESLSGQGQLAFVFSLIVTAGVLILFYFEKYLISFLAALAYVPIVWVFGQNVYMLSDSLYSSHTLQPTFFMFFVIINMIAIVMYTLFSAIAFRNLKKSD